MSLWKIAWRSIQQRALASALTGTSMALGVALVVSVLVIHGAIGKSFSTSNSLGYHLIVGAKGGNTQLVLNTVYYLSQPVENIPYSYYKEFTTGKFKDYVETAVPVCLGDYYQGFRVVGTTPDMFDKLTHGNNQRYEFSSGENFKSDQPFTGVVGATVARETGLKVGDTFQPTHAAPDGHEHKDLFKVVGVLQPTGNPNDRALFINIEGFYMLEGHAKPLEGYLEGAGPPKNSPPDHDASGTGASDDESAHHEPDDHAALDHDAHEHSAADAHDDDDDEHGVDEDHVHDGADHADGEHAHGEHAEEHHHHHEPLPESQREVTAVLVRASDMGAGPAMADLAAADLVKPINKDSVARAVKPVYEISNLFRVFVDPLQIVLLSLTVLIVIVSGISILVSIYNSMSDRRHEIAVMRALGAGRVTVMLIVLFESILLSLGGGLFGWFLGHALIAGLSPWINGWTGVSIGFLGFVGYELVIIPGLIVLASLVGYLPALVAYRTDVAKALNATP